MTEIFASIQYSVTETKYSAFLSHGMHVSNQENNFKALMVQP